MILELNWLTEENTNAKGVDETYHRDYRCHIVTALGFRFVSTWFGD